MRSLRSFYNLAGSAAAAGSTLVGAGTVRAASDFQLPTPQGGSDFSSTSGDLTSSLPDLVTRVLNIVLMFAGILAVAYLIWSGIQYITSGGNADKVKTARSGIINAVIGIIVILSAYFIIKLAVGAGNTVGKQGTSL